MIEELPDGSHQNEASVVVGRGWIGLESGHGSGHRIEVVSPYQFVREGERVALESERAVGMLGRCHDVRAKV
jgi:hypothetical protein